MAGDEPKRRDRQQRRRLEIVEHVVLQLVDDRAEHVRREVAEVDRVAVRRRTLDPRDADGSGGAADVLHDHRWPSVARMRSAKMRPSVSVGPPGGYGTIMVIGREG